MVTPIRIRTDLPLTSTTIVEMVAFLVAWLHLHAHLSRSAANALLCGIQVILSITLQLIQAALYSSGIHVNFPRIEIPRDVRSVYRLCHLEPDLVRTACCPKCFSTFPRPIPWQCQWKASSRSRSCGALLWKMKNTPQGPKWAPRCLFTTQSFDSWVQFFLSRKIIEDSLQETWNRHRTARCSAAFGSEMHDVQDSPAWQRLYDSVSSAHHLIFAVYVDWFNPYTNKIAGEKCFHTQP